MRHSFTFNRFRVAGHQEIIVWAALCFALHKRQQNEDPNNNNGSSGLQAAFLFVRPSSDLRPSDPRVEGTKQGVGKGPNRWV